LVNPKAFNKEILENAVPFKEFKALLEMVNKEKKELRTDS